MKIIVIIALACSQWALAQECGQKGIETADECAYKSAFLLNRNIPVPNSVDQVKAHCASVDQSLDCLANLNNQCVTGPPQMFMKKILGNLKQSMKDRCTNDDNLKEFLDNLMCLDTADKVEQVRRCSDKHIRILQAVSDLATENRMSAMCCALREHQDCMEKTIRDQCGSSQADFFKTLIAEYADEMVMVQCDNFNSMEKCATNLPADQWSVLKPLIETAPGDPMFKSDFKTPIPIMVKMLGKFYKS